MHDTIVWLASFESDFRDEKNGTNLFFLPQKLTKLVLVNGRFKQFLSGVISAKISKYVERWALTKDNSDLI